MTNFSEKLKEARQNKGWNQEEFAEKVSLSQGAISQFEKGLRIPTPANIEKFAKILEVSKDYLIGDEVLTSERVRLMRSIQTLSSEELKVVEGVVNMIKKTVPPPSKAD